MASTTVGIRELKSKLAHYVRHIKAGGTLTITERGKPIGRIIPTKASTNDRVQELIRAGLVSWNGRKLRSFHPTLRPRGKRTIADLLLENRE
ncbi:MAG: type II toxin-antitoxin system prevent-host-death family antitoxin [Chloroflexi bacterium]|nr:type II toxin-antitoxin system prevent-host-death family antitoxin [Chloroflexota bacterium]